MKEKYLENLKKSLSGIELTIDEERFLEWIARMDAWTVEQVVHIISKCRASEN